MTRPHDTQTPTPRTDAAELDALIVDLPGQQTTDKVVRSIIARQLERELSTERERGRRVREETIGIVDEPFHAGSRVTNCVAHMNRDFDKRPDDCSLCRTDISNRLQLAVRINSFLNDKVDRIKAALSRAESDVKTENETEKENDS